MTLFVHLARLGTTRSNTIHGIKKERKKQVVEKETHFWSQSVQQFRHM